MLCDKAFLIELAGVIAATGVSALPAQSPFDGGSVLLRRSDTGRIERFTLYGHGLRSEILQTGGELDEITAWLGANGYLDSLLGH